MVESQPSKLLVAGSIPVSRSKTVDSHLSSVFSRKPPVISRSRQSTPLAAGHSGIDDERLATETDGLKMTTEDFRLTTDDLRLMTDDWRLMTVLPM